MNGMALHGGIVPYSGTFLVFSDYCRPAIRLAALMGQRVIHVMTHDSIGLGEDGPTHQPVEHLAALRAIPNLKVLRPCDTVETIECWQIALESNSGPSVLVLTRQNLPQLRRPWTPANRCARGAYELIAAEGGRAAVSLFASGIGSRHRGRGAETPRRAENFGARRLGARASNSCSRRRRPSARQSSATPASTSPSKPASARAGTRSSAPSGAFVGMSGFGASAPYKELYQHFGITPEKVAEAALLAHKVSCRETGNVSSRSHQRVWSHRPQHFARGCRGGTQGYRNPRHQRSRSGRDQRPPVALQFRARPLSRRGRRQGRYDQLRQRRDQGHRDQGSDAAAVEGTRHRRRARMHRYLHRQGQGGGASDRGRQARFGLGAGRRRRPDGGLRRQPRQADQGAHGRLQRLVYDQLSRAGRQGAQRRRRHRQGLHDDGAFLHQRSADARSGAQGSLPGRAPRRSI